MAMNNENTLWRAIVAIAAEVSPDDGLRAQMLARAIMALSCSEHPGAEPACRECHHPVITEAQRVARRANAAKARAARALMRAGTKVREP